MVRERPRVQFSPAAPSQANGNRRQVALRPDPRLLAVLSHSIVILSVAGLAFGVVWALTRNIYILMVMHAAGDLVPKLSEFMRTAGP